MRTTMVMLVSVLIYGFITAQSEPQSQDSTALLKLKNYISGSQFVTYVRTSPYLDSSNASAGGMTFVNFCPDGTYNYNYEGSYRAKSSGYDGNDYGYGVYGGSSNSGSGTWDIEQMKGMFFLTVHDANGAKNNYPIDVSKLIQGKWQVGDTVYVFAPNNAECN